ncbi:MAG: hypothetical protein JXR03_00455 [Cyclobacteriaceae bacterium]
MCETLIQLDKVDDSTRLQKTSEKHLYPYLAKFNENSKQKLRTSIYIRLQHNCKAFLDLLNRNYAIHEDWQSLSKKPKSKISAKDCKKFAKNENFWYFESNGDKVRLEIKDGIWIDNFKDGTYSKLNFFWIDQSNFEIEFIESNNSSRKNFSKPGDRYHYELIKKNRKYYDVTVEIPDTNILYSFKIYVDK